MPPLLSLAGAGVAVPGNTGGDVGAGAADDPADGRTISMPIELPPEVVAGGAVSTLVTDAEEPAPASEVVGTSCSASGAAATGAAVVVPASPDVVGIAGTAGLP